MYSQRLKLVDGARCLHDEARAVFGDMPIARFRRHLRQHLLTKDRKSLEAYDKLIQIPKNIIARDAWDNPRDGCDTR